MNRFHSRLALAGMAGCFCLAPALLERKGVELPIQNVVAAQSGSVPTTPWGLASFPITCSFIEAPAQTVVATKSSATPVAGGDFVNPKVQPGLVHWHPTFTAACEAARKSGKPVFLFQMMGKLDEQFC